MQAQRTETHPPAFGEQPPADAGGARGARVRRRRISLPISHSLLLSSFFLLGMFLLLPQHFCWFEIVYYVSCDCFISEAGRKPISRKRTNYMFDPMK
jgi:hypothetical protein